jgi:hypothetical protein
VIESVSPRRPRPFSSLTASGFALSSDTNVAR